MEKTILGNPCAQKTLYLLDDILVESAIRAPFGAVRPMYVDMSCVVKNSAFNDICGKSSLEETLYW